MNQEQKIDLVRGVFSDTDALEVLSHLVTAKLNFHGRRAFRLSEQRGEEDKFSERRMEELRDALDQIEALIQEARINGQQVRINGTLQIELTDEAPQLRGGEVVTAAACY